MMGDYDSSPIIHTHTRTHPFKHSFSLSFTHTLARVYPGMDSDTRLISLSLSLYLSLPPSLHGA